MRRKVLLIICCKNNSVNYKIIIGSVVPEANVPINLPLLGWYFVKKVVISKILIVNKAIKKLFKYIWVITSPVVILDREHVSNDTHSVVNMCVLKLHDGLIAAW